MKSLLKTLLTAFAIGLAIGSIGSSQAAQKPHAKKTVAKRTKKSMKRTSARTGLRSASTSSSVGDAMKPKKSLSFEGRSIEALKPGNYDSVSHLDEGDGNRDGRHLYTLPKDFAQRTAEDQSELRYRQ